MSFSTITYTGFLLYKNKVNHLLPTATPERHGYFHTHVR